MVGKDDQGLLGLYLHLASCSWPQKCQEHHHEGVQHVISACGLDAEEGAKMPYSGDDELVQESISAKIVGE
jgi:hypothetical protein